MKKIFWRVLIYFSVVLLVFTVLIGLMFTRFNRTNIVGAYKQQLGDLATDVAKRTSRAAKDGDVESFMNYLRVIEDFGSMQDIDIWIVSHTKGRAALDSDYTNVDLNSIKLPEQTQAME